MYHQKIGCVVTDTQDYIRFVEANGSIRMIRREYVTMKFREGTPYYLYNGKGEILYDYNHTLKDDQVAIEFATSDIHY